MTELPYKIKIASVEKLNRPFAAEFGRINVILGSNGTGKSKVLHALKDNHAMFGTRTDVAFVEGGRTFTIPSSLAMNKQTVNLATLDLAERSHKKKRAQKLSDRIIEALFALDRMGEAEYRKHSETVVQWDLSGKIGPTPKRSEPPLEQLCAIFCSIFPEIDLTINPESKSIICKKNGSNPYQPSELSDGEKQVFCLIADLLLLSKGNPLIVVDEPELNLNASLAIDLWSLIESTLPEAVFVYATHSVAFAIKPGVSSLMVLPRTGLDPIIVKDLSEVDQQELKSFLGAIPAILANSKAIAVEGEKSSLDTILYRWIVGDSTVNIEAVGSCHNVVSAVKRDGIWKTIGVPQKLVGVVDRDFRSEEYLKAIENGAVNVLPFHEIESILSLPKVLCLLSQRLGLVKSHPSEEEVKEAIVEKWTSEHVGVAIRRTFDALRTEFCPSIPRGVILKANGDIGKLENKLIDSYELELKKVQSASKKEAIVKEFQEQVAFCKDALTRKDVLTILRLMPGKVMAGEVLKWTGCSTIDAAARGVTKHISTSEIPVIADFKRKLCASLGISEAEIEN